MTCCFCFFALTFSAFWYYFLFKRSKMPLACSIPLDIHTSSLYTSLNVFWEINIENQNGAKIGMVMINTQFNKLFEIGLILKIKNK